MNQKITPFLWLEDKCEEALDFYCSVFFDAKVKSVTRYPKAVSENIPVAGMEGKVLTAVFELFGQEFMAIDGGPNVFPRSGAVSLYVECEDQAEVDRYWNRLTEGSNPKSQQCGWVQDKYGFSWQIVPKQLSKYTADPDPVRNQRVMKVFMQMKKIVIDDLERAYQGE